MPESLSTVAVFSPSDSVAHPGWAKKSKNVLAKRGISVSFSKNAFNKHQGCIAGTLAERTQDLQSAMDHQFAWVLGGGYFADQLVTAFSGQIEKIRDNDTRLIGYSDVDLFTNMLFAAGVKSVFGPNFGWFWGWDQVSQQTLISYIKSGKMRGLPQASTCVALHTGEAKGRLLASGLDCLTLALGSKHDPLGNGDDPVILLLEEYQQDTSTFRRQLKYLTEHSKFSRVVGIAFGRLHGLKDKSYRGWTKRVSKLMMIRDVLGSTAVPIAMFNDIGHSGEAGSSFRFRSVEKGAVYHLEVGRKCSLINIDGK